jgi:hypothetical protein
MDLWNQCRCGIGPTKGLFAYITLGSYYLIGVPAGLVFRLVYDLQVEVCPNHIYLILEEKHVYMCQTILNSILGYIIMITKSIDKASIIDV